MFFLFLLVGDDFLEAGLDVCCLGVPDGQDMQFLLEFHGHVNLFEDILDAVDVYRIVGHQKAVDTLQGEDLAIGVNQAGDGFLGFGRVDVFEGDDFAEDLAIFSMAGLLPDVGVDGEPFLLNGGDGDDLDEFIADIDQGDAVHGKDGLECLDGFGDGQVGLATQGDGAGDAGRRQEGSGGQIGVELENLVDGGGVEFQGDILARTYSGGRR